MSIDSKRTPALLFPILAGGSPSWALLLGSLARSGSPTAQAIAVTAQVQRRKWKLLMLRFWYRITCFTSDWCKLGRGFNFNSRLFLIFECTVHSSWPIDHNSSLIASYLLLIEKKFAPTQYVINRESLSCFPFSCISEPSPSYHWALYGEGSAYLSNDNSE